MVKRRRRSPIHHRVTSHRRGGHSVGNYTRGSGSKSPGVPRRRSKSLKSKSPVEAFTVTLKYRTGKSEKINVFAPRGSYKKALDEALEERTRKAMPVEINILDPSLGEVISFIGKGIGTGLKYVKAGVKAVTPSKQTRREIKRELEAKARGVGRGLKKVGRGARRVSVAAGKGVISASQNREIKKLLKKSYSKDKAEKDFARVTLKRKYPEIYDNASFSRRKRK